MKLKRGTRTTVQQVGSILLILDQYGFHHCQPLWYPKPARSYVRVQCHESLVSEAGVISYNKQQKIEGAQKQYRGAIYIQNFSDLSSLYYLQSSRFREPTIYYQVVLMVPSSLGFKLNCLLRYQLGSTDLAHHVSLAR